MSDKDTSLADLKEAVREFCEVRDWAQFHSPKDLAIGMITEASEFLEHFRFRSDLEVLDLMKCPENREEVADELADTLFMAFRFAGLYGFDISEALLRKLQKNQEKYPVHKCRGKNLKYTKLNQSEGAESAD